MMSRNLIRSSVIGLTALASLSIVALGRAQSIPPLTVTGVAPNHSSARIFYDPVAGAKDYRIYDTAAAHNVKYAGLNHRSSGPQADGPSTDIEWNGLGDTLAHTLVVEAVDQLGPVPYDNLYAGENVPLSGTLAAGAMLGSNKGPTRDGNVSTNGQGSYVNNPQVIARSQPFVVQANQSVLPVPSMAGAEQVFLDTFENAENVSIRQTARSDSTRDAFNNLGSMTFSMNAGTSKEWTIEYRQSDNMNSMPFVTNNHFMDVLFDGATPFTSAPTHTIYGSMSMNPSQNVTLNGGILHMTMEVDAHNSFRRWVDFNLAPASDPLQAWGGTISPSGNAIFLTMDLRGCTLDIFTGHASNGDPSGTAGGSHGARLWGQAGSTGGGAVICYLPHGNGLGLDDRSRFDLFISPTHAALYQDGLLAVQSDIPAGTFPWAEQTLKVYYTHYLYHSDADKADLKAYVCYPQNAYWFNDPVNGTAATDTNCGAPYPPGYGFQYSDERHWDNMGFEVLPGSAAAASDYSTLGALVQPSAAQAPQFVAQAGTPAPTATATATATPTTVARTATAVPPTVMPNAQPLGTWTNVTPANADLVNPLNCDNSGTESIVADPDRPSNLYTEFMCQGIWKSTDYGQTWTGPIDTGVGAKGGGGISIGRGSPGQPPRLYSAAIRGTGLGFWRSLDDGVTWTQYNIAPLPANRQDVYPPAVDPYDSNHLIMAGHEQNALVQSVDGGQTWTNVTLAAGMNSTQGGTAFIFFIDTGGAISTRNTWLYTPQAECCQVGTWRTSDGGVTWTRLNGNEHVHGSMQIYQPNSGGVVYMPGVYSALGDGMLRSTDWGQTWVQVGLSGRQVVAFGTPNRVFAMDISAEGETALQPGINGWTKTLAPAGMTVGPAQAAVVFDGSHHVIVSANWKNGLWRYVDPGSGATPVPTATSVPSATSTPTAVPTSTSVPSTATPVPTNTAIPTATSTPVVDMCRVSALLNATPVTYSRPLSFCSDQ